MSQKPPARAMRENPDREQLKRQARELFGAYMASSPEAVAEVTNWHRNATPETFALHDAQFVLARAYGFESWPKLKAAAEGVTAARLHQAVEAGDVDGARDLLTRRPEIVDAAHGSMRALQRAVVGRDLAMTTLLLDFGADTKSGDWTSPYVIARDRGYNEIVEVIREARRKRGAVAAPAEATHKLELASRTRSEEALVAVFDEYPALAESTRADGVTMLHQAVGHGALFIIKWLLDHGADVNRKADYALFHCATFLPRSRQGWTPLDFAAAGWNGEWLFDNGKFARVAAFLLQHGAQLSPLSAATLGRWDYLGRLSKQELVGKGLLEAAVKGDQPEILRRLLDLGLDPDERIQVGHMAEPVWSVGGPLFQAVVLNHIEMARLLLECGADPNARVFTAGSAADKAYGGGNPEMLALVQKYGGWIDPGSVGYGRHTEIARKMLAGEIDPHCEPNDFAGPTVAEQLLWGGASSLSAEIVRMALEQIDWPPEDPRWFGMLLRPVLADAPEQAECCECFQLILARSGPHHHAKDFGPTILHKVVECGENVELAIILLNAGARLDTRDELLKSTPLGWACRWGRVGLVKFFLASGADAVEADAEPWATPRAWAEKMTHREIVGLLNSAGPQHQA